MENSDQANGQKVIISQLGTTVAELALRLYKLEKVVNYIYMHNKNLNLPSDQDLLRMNIDSVEETKRIPGVRWVADN